MRKSQIRPMPKFFDRYITLVAEEDLDRALALSQEELARFDRAKALALGDRVYAPGKWQVADLLQHVIDNERIQSYRALRIGRGDPTPLPGYDENLLAANAQASRRSVDALLAELDVVRHASRLLFASLGDEALARVGVSNQIEISPLALAFVIVGHQQHHFRILEERYFPLLA
jgi:hypothetical protein